MQSLVGGSRRAAMLLAGATLLFVAAFGTDGARAGSYIVRQCNANGVGMPSAGTGASFSKNDSRYFEPNSCGSSSPFIGVRNNGQPGNGTFGAWQWTAPAGTAITGVWGYARLDNDKGFRGRVFLRGCTTCGYQDVLGDNGSANWTSLPWGRHGAFGGVRAFGVRLVCTANPCQSSNNAKADLAHLLLYVSDSSRPTPYVGGSLMGSGWHRGNGGLSFDASDQGGGVSAYAVYVNGKQVGGAFGQCSQTSQGFAARMQPCSTQPSGRSANGNTVTGPWANGANRVQACAWDYGAGGTANKNCTSVRTVRVDNEVPEVAFRNTQGSADPELIRAPVDEDYSGVEWSKISYAREGTDEWHDLPTAHQGGELRARVDSEAVPPGRYKFKARAEDEAGNASGEVLARENGQPMVLRFPLRADSQLRAGIGDGALRRTIKYGRTPEIRGRLLSADRDPLAEQTVKVQEQYAPGSLEAQHTHEAVTDKDGRFVLRLPTGPSRDVQVTYPGSKRFRPAGAQELGVKVRSGVKFNTSRKRVPGGQSVTFGGKVRHDGTQIPANGKLVELQVREGAHKWETVREAFSTRGDGKFSTSYRFGNFYSRPVRFSFRVKVTRENGWPYKAPVRSRARRVTVVP